MTPQQQMITDSFRNETYVQNRMDVQHTPLWDTITYAAAAQVTETNSSFFTSVGPASAKTLAGTNMTQEAKLPAPEAFSILGFRFRYREDILLADALALQTAATGLALTFRLGKKPYNQAPLWFYNAGGGVSGFTTRSDSSVYTNGVPSREGMHKLAIPIVIENQMVFAAHLEGTAYTLTAAGAGGTGLEAQLLLDGLYARGVQ